MDILKIATAGSVDDGKSTLIGRLLFETNSLKNDQLNHIKNKSKIYGYDYLDFSLATDGLLTEREQGITIDVSNIYFSTSKMRFIIADSPGHEEYTRNMVTGASTSEIAIILLDARKGVINQTKRHFYITQLLEINHVIVAINKMDLINYSSIEYTKIIDNFMQLLSCISNKNLNLNFIPISALKGDNIVTYSKNMTWYHGIPLLNLLENINLKNPLFDEKVFQVQYVIRPKTTKLHDYRGFAGKLRSGHLKIGDKIIIFPSKRTSRIKRIEKYGIPIRELFQGESGVILLEDEIDISRGTSIIGENFTFSESKTIRSNICWMQSESLLVNDRILIQHGVHLVAGKVKKIFNKINLKNLKNFPTSQLNLNDIGNVEIQLANPILGMSYKKNSKLGAFIIIDNMTNNTAGVGFLN